MVLACQVCPFHLKLTKINSEMNCIAKNKCLRARNLTRRRRGENLNGTSHVSRAITYISVRKSDFHSKIKSYSVECLCYYCNPTDRWFIPRLDKVNIVTWRLQQTHKIIATAIWIPWLARTIYKYANAFFVFVYFCDTSKASENLTFSLNKVSLYRLFVLL